MRSEAKRTYSSELEEDSLRRYDPFVTYIDGAAEASRYKGSNDHEGDNNLDGGGYVSHLALILSFLLNPLKVIL
jgi:hypothetical protein